MKTLSRRDFLKVASMMSVASVLPVSFRMLAEERNAANALPNIIVLVFDTMSASNLSLYGYRRNTTPNLERFAERATVLHNHYAGGNYTTPGTATILTGTYPWTHRAINQSGLILRRRASHNLFSRASSIYNTFAFTQNLWADCLLNQFGDDIATYLLPGSFSLVDKSMGKFFLKDENAATRVADDFFFQTSKPPASLVFGALEKQLFLHRLAQTSDKGYSRGLPHDVSYPKYFRLEDVFQGVDSQLISLKPPFLAYIHLYAPHEPYRPRIEFENIFNDNWRPDSKPVSIFSDGSSYLNLTNRRTNYDEYVANVDAEFGKLFDRLNAQGILANSILIVTSDHGQLFERGVHGHTTPLLFDPVVHVPLLVSVPGQTIRQDVHTPTSNTDLLPTLLYLTGQEIPAWVEGTVLPGLGGADDPERSIFMVEAKSNPAFSPLKKATIAMRKNNYKLIYYSGYLADPWFELYDLEQDPEELKNLFPSTPSIASSLRDELLAALDQSNQNLGR